MADQSPAPSPALAFGGVAEAYDRGRPAYPTRAAAWLVGHEPCTVLELGAGTGKLTAELVGLGHDVHATDPDPAMLEVLRRRLPDVRATEASAEELPVPDRSVDVVVAAQSFHWFDAAAALPEVARVLRPGGRLALVWNEQDTRIPWVRRLGALLGRPAPREPATDLLASGLFGFVEDATFPHWQVVDRDSVRDLALSTSAVAALDEEARAAKLDEVVAFYDDYGRGMDGMQLPYAARCFRAAVVEQARPEPEPADEPADAAEEAAEHAPADTGTDTVSDGTDTDMLLIDFR